MQDIRHSDRMFVDDYAGFWRRFVAYVIDNILLVILVTILNRNIEGAYNCMDISSDFGVEFWVCGPTALGNAIFLAVSLVVFAGFESSPLKATPGKMLFGITVVDQSGGRVSFARALLRNAGKFVSWLTLMIGFTMAAFTQRKQALHDLIAGCLVIRRDR